MKKKDVIRFLGEQKLLNKKIKSLEKKIDQTNREYLRLVTIGRHLEFANMIDGVPVYLYNTYGGINVLSSFEESNRAAFLENVPNSRKYKLKLLKSENNHVIYDKILTKKQALTIAALWIDKGDVW